MQAIVASGKADAADSETVNMIEHGFTTLQAASDCKSLLKKHLTEAVMEKLKSKKTKLGATLWDVIRSGVKNLDSAVGVYAPDAEAYTLFKDLFDPIIEEYHGFKSTDSQPTRNFGERNVGDFVNLDPENNYILSTRIRCGRSFVGYPFNPCLSETNYKEVEDKVKKILESISDPDLQGTYFALAGMSKEHQDQLVADHMLFKEGDRFLKEANAYRFWPTGRGVFCNEKKTLHIRVNEEDHMRIISMQPGSDIGAVFGRLIKCTKLIQEKADFSRDDRLGWLTFCPTNLGTSIRASVHLKIPKLSAKPEFQELCEELKLQARGTHGEHSVSIGGVYDISNKARMGVSVFDTVKTMYDGVKKLIEIEKAAK